MVDICAIWIMSVLCNSFSSSLGFIWVSHVLNINLFTKLTSHTTWQLTDCWVSNKCQFHQPFGENCGFYFHTNFWLAGGLLLSLCWICSRVGICVEFLWRTFWINTEKTILVITSLDWLPHEAIMYVPGGNIRCIVGWKIILRKVDSINIFNQFGQFDNIQLLQCRQCDLDTF